MQMPLPTHVETVNNPSHLYVYVSVRVRVRYRIRLRVKVRSRAASCIGPPVKYLMIRSNLNNYSEN
jgi:hypothetical protein